MATKTEREELLRLLHLIFLYAHMHEPGSYGKTGKNAHFYLGAIQAASKEALDILRGHNLSSETSREILEEWEVMENRDAAEFLWGKNEK